MDASEIERLKAKDAELREKKVKETHAEAISEIEKSDSSGMDADEGQALVSEEIIRSTQFEVGSGVEAESNKEKVGKSIGVDGDGELGTKSTDLASDKEKEQEGESSVIGLNPSFESQQTEVLVTVANPLVDASSSDLRISKQESVSEPPLNDKKREAKSLSEDGRSDQIKTDQSNLESNEASDVSTAPESDTDSETESSISSIEEHDEENSLPGSLLVYSMAKLLLYFMFFFFICRLFIFLIEIVYIVQGTELMKENFCKLPRYIYMYFGIFFGKLHCFLLYN